MKSDLKPNQWMDISAAAKYCNCSISFLRTQINKGRLKHTRSGGDAGKILFKTEWLDEMLMEGARNG